MLLLTGDLFFAMPIRAQLSARGLTLETGRDSSWLAASLTGGETPARLAIVDMNLLRSTVDWEAMRTLTTDPTSPPIIGFGPHTDIETRRAAKAAGLRRIYANGEFRRDLDAILTRHLGTPTVRD